MKTPPRLILHVTSSSVIPSHQVLCQGPASETKFCSALMPAYFLCMEFCSSWYLEMRRHLEPGPPRTDAYCPFLATISAPLRETLIAAPVSQHCYGHKT